MPDHTPPGTHRLWSGVDDGLHLGTDLISCKGLNTLCIKSWYTLQTQSMRASTCSCMVLDFPIHHCGRSIGCRTFNQLVVFQSKSKLGQECNFLQSIFLVSFYHLGTAASVRYQGCFDLIQKKATSFARPLEWGSSSFFETVSVVSQKVLLIGKLFITVASAVGGYITWKYTMAMS